jgi:hypothetical protein
VGVGCPRGIIGFDQFWKLHRQIQYVTFVIPCMKFLMTLLNCCLTQQGEAVGLGKDNPLRRTILRLCHLLDIAQAQLTHISAIVTPDLPHYYGTVVDAAVVEAGGMWLPCLRHIQPTMWQVKWPDDIKAAVRQGMLSMADCESAAYFIQECMLDHLLGGEVVGISIPRVFQQHPHGGTHQTQVQQRGVNPLSPRPCWNAWA